MTLELTRPDDLLGMVNVKEGTVDRRIFADQDIYELELERIFARAWNFMCHESQIKKPGDFFTTYIGEDRVIVVRDREGGVQVLLNTCRHRGNAVCRAEQGHASSFMCTYHGWTYDLKGHLVGVPGFKEIYNEDLDREQWGLLTAGKVDSFKGFVFATMDPDAVELDEYLGEVGRLCLNSLALHGDNEVVGGIQKYTIGCNWKFAADNVWDFYHGMTTHVSAYMTDPKRNASSMSASGRYKARHLVFPGEYGHVYSGPASPPPGEANPRAENGRAGSAAWREKPETLAEMGRIGIQAGGHPHIFPNMWITSNQVWLRLPKGPMKTELWAFLMLDKNLPREERKRLINLAEHGFGPAGLWEQDDGENWDQSTRGMVGVVAKRAPLHYGMNLGRGEIIDEEGGPPYIETHINEHAQLWHYRSWAEWMAAMSWQDLKKNHSQPTGTL